jgi:hypothetical protein
METHQSRSMIRVLWEAWKAFGHKVGTFQARVLLTVFYFTISVPFVCIVRLFLDPLHMRRQKTSNWVAKIPLEGDALAQAHKEF